MKIRQKITLWISATALVAAISFSAFVFVKLLNQPYKLIDEELNHMAASLLRQSSAIMEGDLDLSAAALPHPLDWYWIRITGADGKVLFASAMTRYVDIAFSGTNGKNFTLEKTVPRELIDLGQDEYDEVTFRAGIVQGKLDGVPCTVAIAKPIEELEEELHELVLEVGAALATCTLLIVLASYILAGRILQPIATINRLARQINENTLDQRIPEPESRDELAELIRTLNRMFDRLHYSFSRQKQFLADASHELKSPIALLMLGQEEMLQKPGLPEEVRTGLTRQLDSLRRLNRLVKNLLDLSHLEQSSGPRDHSAVDLTGLTGQIMEEFAEMLAARQITAANDLARDLIVVGDAEKLRRLLINLIDNAIRYNLARDGRLEVRGWEEEGEVHIEIANTGPEIPAEDIERVFEQFHRVEKSRSLAHGGSGLGLTIAKRIVELHGGRIRLASAPGDLTRVTVSLPAGGT